LYTFRFLAYLVKVILSVPGEGYFERHLVKVITETRRAH
jgi:hypothetical protein